MSEIPERLSAALTDRYRIERELGAGGMATVYLARDLKHDRQVAIKVLKPELAAVLGADRFVQEITTTAQLQHPNILPLFDSGSADGFLYYVMPYVEGETLRAKLNRATQLSVDEAVKITTEVADALQYAHEHGVVHRDIKPENILLHAGRPMVADFGIALAVSAAAGGRMTETGLSLGTPHYMSPEQATAEKTITGRSDIYSLGAVLYEMLTGDPPHTGKTAQQIIAKIVTEAPAPVTKARRSVPPNVAAALAKALEKLPADRFEKATAFAEALTNPAFTGAGPSGRFGAGAARPRSRAVTYLTAGAFVVLTAVAAWGWIRPVPTPPPSYQRIVLGTAYAPNLSTGSAIAPDGSAIVYPDTVGGREQLWIKERTALEPRPLAPTSTLGLAPGPSFSPDGRWIAYENGRLQKIARQGGAPIQLSDSGAAGSTAWLDNGTIVFIGGSGRRVYATSADGGATRRVLSADSTRRYFFQLSAVPNADAVLVGAWVGDGAKVFVLDLTTDSLRALGVDAVAAWVARRTLIYGTAAGQLLAVPFDTRHLGARGSPTSILQEIGAQTGVNDATLAQDGTLLYTPALSSAVSGKAELVTVTRDGAVTRLDTTWAGNVRPQSGAALSPDGTWLALPLADSATGNADIYVLRLATGIATRLTFNGTTNLRPAWSPDGASILYVSDAGARVGLRTKHADGTGSATEVTLPDSRPVWEGRWSQDGKWLIYRTDDQYAGNGDIYAVRTPGGAARIVVAATDASETGPALTPDGRWIAYSSDATGRREVYVRPFPNTSDGIWQVSNDGGTEPEWAHSGNELFYRNAAGDLMAVAVSAAPTFAPGTHTVLFRAGSYLTAVENHMYAVMPDDRHFLFIQPVRGPQIAAGGLVLARHWLLEVERNVGRGR
jgi:eukaryotic-like serine/threonine-protein kinase